MTRTEGETTFINVDLDLEAPRDLAPFVAALGERVFELHTGPLGNGFECHLEVAANAGGGLDADATVQEFIRLLRELPPSAKELWDSATRRDFNVGIQAGTQPFAFVFALSHETVEGVAALGASVVVTVYGAESEGPYAIAGAPGRGIEGR